MKTLTDMYLTSNKIRDQLMKDGVIQYDDHCRVCHKLGDLLCCETCSAVYHLACCDPPLEEVWNPFFNFYNLLFSVGVKSFHTSLVGYHPLSKILLHSSGSRWWMALWSMHCSQAERSLQLWTAAWVQRSIPATRPYRNRSSWKQILVPRKKTHHVSTLIIRVGWRDRLTPCTYLD